MKAFSFCLKVEDERGAAVRDLVALTDQIKSSRSWGKKCEGGVRRVRMFLPNWIRGGGEGKGIHKARGPCFSAVAPQLELKVSRRQR